MSRVVARPSRYKLRLHTLSSYTHHSETTNDINGGYEHVAEYIPIAQPNLPSPSSPHARDERVHRAHAPQGLELLRGPEGHGARKNEGKHKDAMDEDGETTMQQDRCEADPEGSIDGDCEEKKAVKVPKEELVRGCRYGATFLPVADRGYP
ncbi:hypothetical protein DICSQDRAFT_173981 [Dichomitus squalens LYAD-421 SS1]|uniref:Uncharacterized protein n=1 Tax=Dichomitus squalens (strain LYAD-421) TaxID=732165 RepID=R7SMM4_DICSQ|nr:uncharacterized protein DICSQDRAFT_173981 [Dichomitus squalens LYAD-421 SS1]EJF57424.1 hypothetical protein DICSQDRAFT_173981 [Dichomitus squalens LYAD-421 SS1]